MSKKNVLVKSDQRKKLSDVAVFLRELADKIESGQVTLMQGGQDVQIELPQTVMLELEYYEKAKKHGVKKQLDIELEWTEGGKKRQGVSLG
jgi:amphi-Trp domain-containing protein